MKSRKLWALFLFLLGVIACAAAFQRFIVYSDASDSARNLGYEADRASGQKRMDMQREADNRYDRVRTPQIQAILSGLIGVGLILASVVLLVRRKENDNEMNAPTS